MARAATLGCLLIGSLLAACGVRAQQPAPAPYLVVLGVAQDGGVPQTGTGSHPGWTDPAKRRQATALALINPTTAQRWLFEATPDFRLQLRQLDLQAQAEGTPGLAGVFLTHAHMGHYTGLMYLGHESMGAQGVPVFAMPRLAAFLRANGPWSQLVQKNNIALQPLADGVPVRLADGLTVTPFLVPHRQEYSEVVGFRIDGPHRSVLFIPDIDSWDAWDADGSRLEDRLAEVDIAFLDGTFFADGEIPGRDMSTFPHPLITHTMERLGGLPIGERLKVRFIHLNHTNPALWPDSAARRAIDRNGFRVAQEGERVTL